MKKIAIRHGDICFHPVDKVEGKEIKHEGKFIVGYGETTGHCHVLTLEKSKDLVIRKDSKGNFYFELLSEGTLSHEDHKSIKLPPGLYKKFQEEEVDHFAQSVTRKVID